MGNHGLGGGICPLPPSPLKRTPAIVLLFGTGYRTEPLQPCQEVRIARNFGGPKIWRIGQKSILAIKILANEHSSG